MSAATNPLTITFVRNPPFTIDFNQFCQKPVDSSKSLIMRAQSAAFRSIDFVKIFFKALGRSAHLTLSYSGASFKHIVLGYYGNLKSFSPPADIYLAFFRLLFWVAALTLSFFSNFARTLYKEFFQNQETTQAVLKRFAGSEINPSHMVTKDLSIDVSHVPQQVKVDQLLAIFDQINFDRRDLPGYMAPSSRKEGTQEYTKEDLRQALQTFVEYVNQRKAFLGTPPAYDTPRLFQFYQQIENAVRFSVHEAEFALSAFHREHPENPNTYARAALRTYKDLLETRARVALNLAFAGKHCGARFMGESMELYNSFNKEKILEEGSLKDTLNEILAHDRGKIASARARIEFGGEVHGDTKYLENFGEILAIPGSQGVVEHLASNLDRTKHLRAFFQDYSVNRIIDTVQNAFKTSKVFARKVYDWVGDQRGRWIPIDEQNLPDIRALEAALAQNQVNLESEDSKNFAHLQDLIHYLNGKQVACPQAPDDQLIDELFALKDVKDWADQKFNAQEKQRRKQKIKDLFADLGPQLLAAVKNALTSKSPLLLAPFSEALVIKQKTALLVSQARLEQQVAARVVARKKDLQQAIEERQQQLSKTPFLEEMEKAHLQKNGLSREMLEWILVANQVLLPQQRGA